jgi:phage FluMu protein Com
MQASSHISGRGCAKCASKFNTRSFIERATKLHGDTYNYSESVYVSATSKIEIICRTHGKFLQVVSSHLQGKKCPKCSSIRGHSKVAIRWIEEEAKSRRMKGVMHAGNGGEFTLPGTRIRVDGYHPSTKTVFEFHGDAFHGNPLRYKPRTRPNPFSSKSASTLYKETLRREQTIRNLGYRLIVKWESEYKLK